MISCVKEGKLRACLDMELPEAEARAISQHLIECSLCRTRFERLRSSAAAVAAAIDSLPPVSAAAGQDTNAALARILSAPRRRLVPSPLQVSLACAGLALLVLIIAVTEYRSVVSVVSNPKKAAVSVRNDLPPATESGSESDASAGADLNDEDGYLPLDDGEPIQMGFVVRMNLPESVLTPWEGNMQPEVIEADVIVDETGRARAIRFLR